MARRVTPPQPAGKPSRPAAAEPARPASAPATSGNFKDALLAEIRKAKGVFYNTVVAQAQKIDVAGDRVTFSFSPAQRALKDQFEQQRAWLETLAQPIAGRRIAFASDADRAGAPRCAGGDGG